MKTHPQGERIILKIYLFSAALICALSNQALSTEKFSNQEIDWWVNVSPLGLGNSGSQTGTVNRSGIGMRLNGITYSIRNAYYENTTLLDSLNKVSECITDIDCDGSELITVNEWSFLVGKSFLSKALTFSTGVGYSEIEYGRNTQDNSNEFSLPLEAAWSPARNGNFSANVSLLANISKERSFYGLALGLDFGSL
ncbi:MAG: hypothetical protein V7785_11425 [Bermanella sp.]